MRRNVLLAGLSARARAGAYPVGLAAPAAGGTQTLSYTEDATTDFPNPERGWYRDANSESGTLYPRPTGGDWATTTLYSPVESITDARLNHKYVRLDSYREGALTSAYLTDHAAELASYRATGRKAVLRYAYSRSSGGEDAAFAIVTDHISDLGTLWTTYQDVIAVLQMGFVGDWGEWGFNTSSNDLMSGSDAGGKYHIQIMQAALDAAPADMMVAFRYPNLIGPNDSASSNYPGFFTGDYFEGADRFDGTEQARAALYNDCYLDNVYNGSWWNPWDGTTTAGDEAITDSVNPFTPMGGETCTTGGQNVYNEGAGAVTTMERTCIDYLHANYDTNKIDLWAATAHPDGGNYLEHISRRLGYRLVLNSATVPTTVTAGASMSVTLDLTNRGFGKVFNPRPIDLVFVGSGGPFTARMSSDARRDLPLGGANSTPTFTFNAPAGLTSGASYALHLRLPDPSSNLEADNDYAIRLANSGLWDASTGRHALGMPVVAS